MNASTHSHTRSHLKEKRDPLMRVSTTALDARYFYRFCTSDLPFVHYSLAHTHTRTHQTIIVYLYCTRMFHIRYRTAFIRRLLILCEEDERKGTKNMTNSCADEMTYDCCCCCFFWTLVQAGFTNTFRCVYSFLVIPFCYIVFVTFPLSVSLLRGVSLSLGMIFKNHENQSAFFISSVDEMRGCAACHRRQSRVTKKGRNRFYRYFSIVLMSSCRDRNIESKTIFFVHSHDAFVDRNNFNKITDLHRW